MESGKVSHFTPNFLDMHQANTRELRNIKSVFFFFFPTQILPGVRIIIANPETKGPLGDSHLGEVSGLTDDPQPLRTIGAIMQESYCSITTDKTLKMFLLKA